MKNFISLLDCRGGISLFTPSVRAISIQRENNRNRILYPITIRSQDRKLKNFLNPEDTTKI